MLNNFMRRNKEKMKRNQIIGYYLKALKVKIVRSKKIKCKVGLFDQV